MRPKTITSSYLDLQTKLHQRPDYGAASLSFAPIVAERMSRYSLTTLSDYGAGKKNLLRGLSDLGVHPNEYFPYDPVFPEYGEPKPAELVCCIDVLEHIEPQQLDNVLSELASITTNFGFFSIHTGPAVKILADGRNAHLIQQPSSWWLPRIANFFEVVELQSEGLGGWGFWILVKPKTPSPTLKQRFRSWLIRLRHPSYTLG
jgi:hypothetical protein